MEDRPSVKYYYLADLYDDEYASDANASDLDEEDITEKVYEDLEQEYGSRPDYIEVYIHDPVGRDTEIEVLIDWEL